jgi:hypothetical protein
MGQLSFTNRAIAMSFFGNPQDDVAYRNADKNSGGLFGFDSGKILAGHLFKETRNCLWGFQGGFGGPETINIFTGWPWLTHTTADLSNPATNEPPIAFYQLFGSYFGDLAYYTNNNLLRATLGTPNYGLAAIWHAYPFWQLQKMAIGETLGDCLVRTINTKRSLSSSTRHLAIMGDPSLRMNVFPPPANVRVVQADGSKVVLGWDIAFDPLVLYHVYRATTADGPFNTRLNALPVNSTSFTDTSPPSGTKVYQVRAVKLVSTGSGSYTNFSQGTVSSVVN